HAHPGIALRKGGERALRVEERRVAVVAAGDDPRAVRAQSDLPRGGAHLEYARRLTPELRVRKRSATRERVGLLVGDDVDDALLGEARARRVGAGAIGVRTDAHDEGRRLGV